MLAAFLTHETEYGSVPCMYLLQNFHFTSIFFLILGNDIDIFLQHSDYYYHTQFRLGNTNNEYQGKYIQIYIHK